MDVEIRTDCVLCNHSLAEFITFKNFPTKCLLIRGSTPMLSDMRLGHCLFCGSVQQMNLPNQKFIYGDYPYDTSYSPQWNSHNEALIDFVDSNVPAECPIIDVGASGMKLASKLHETHADYTVFDFSLATAKRLPGFKYVEGNCEEHEFPAHAVVLMSHVFEHLYKPSRFLSRCKGGIILALPNMNDETRVLVTREHTFTFSDGDIDHLFSRHGFALKAKQVWGDNHSIFYFYQPDPQCAVISQVLRPSRWLVAETYFSSPLTLPNECIIAGAGFVTQTLLARATNPGSVVGIIDNDSMKHGHLFYGTTHVVQPFSSLSSAKDSTSVVVVAGNRWTDEMVRQIVTVNSTVAVIVIDISGAAQTSVIRT